MNNALGARTVFAVSFLPSSGSSLLAGTDGGLFKTTNLGTSWTPLTNGLTATAIAPLFFDPAFPSTIYAGTNAGVFESTDNGESWAPLNLGMPEPAPPVNFLIRAPGPAGSLYAATSRGVFVLTSELETRARVTRPASAPRTPRTVHHGP